MTVRRACPALDALIHEAAYTALTDTTSPGYRHESLEVLDDAPVSNSGESASTA